MQTPTPDNFVFYEMIGSPSEDGECSVYMLRGISTTLLVNGISRDAIHLLRRYNVFDETPTLIPDGYKQTLLYNPDLKEDADFCNTCHKEGKACSNCLNHRKDWCEKFAFGSKILAEKYVPKVISHPNTDVFMIHDNGGRPFKVYVDFSAKHVYVYRIRSGLIFNDSYQTYETTCVCMFSRVTQVELAFDNTPPKGSLDPLDPDPQDTVDTVTYYDELVCKYSYINIWVPVGEYLTRNGSDIVQQTDPWFAGNSILVHLEANTGRNKYLSIGNVIHEFIVDDTIKDYHSLVGNSDVPYPVAVGEKYIYFMLDMATEPFEKYIKLTPNEMADAYTYFYGHTCIVCGKNGCKRCTLPTFEKTPLESREICGRV